MVRIFAVAAVLMLGTPCAAQQVGNDDSTFADGVLVTSADVLTCPYRFVQPVTANVTEDYGGNGRAVIFSKLRDSAKALGADAVVLVVKGKGHMSAWAFSRRSYTGRAIRYVDRTCAPTQ